jgi:hypothetical protein
VPTIYLPSSSAEQWSPLLAEPEKHWRTGYSAKAVAHCWQDANGFPLEVAKVLRSAPQFEEIELLIAIPEHQVALPGGSRPSQNDVWALARNTNHLVSIAVEGKVNEPFGPTLEEWLREGSTGKQTRLSFLLDLLGLTAPLPGSIRYQLLHRAASAVIEAKRFCAPQAVMLVHSFSPTSEWFSDYAAFVGLFDVEAGKDQLRAVGQRGGVQLHLAWVAGDPHYLRS